MTKYMAGVYVTTIFAGAFAFGVGFDLGVSAFYDRWNKGVRFVCFRSYVDTHGVLETMERYPP